MPEFAFYFENSFGCNVFLWFNVIYISLFLSLLLFLDVLFSYIEIHLGSTELSLCQCASSTPLLTALSRSLSLHWLRSLCGSLFLWLPSHSLCIHRQRQRQRPLCSPPYSFCVSVSAIALCAHIRCEPKNPKTHNNKRTLWTIFLLFLLSFSALRTMFSPCCALAFVFVPFCCSLRLLWAAAVGFSARKLHNQREMRMRPAMRFDSISTRAIYIAPII